MAGVKGRSGRLPKPTKLLLLQGTARKDRHVVGRKGEPPITGDGSVPPPPGGLSKETQAAWLELADGLKFRIFSREDQRAFQTFATMWAEWKKLSKHVQDNGVSVESEMRDGRIQVKTSPEAAMWADLNRGLLSYFARFGMTPVDRARVREQAMGATGNENPDDEFSR